MGWYRYKRPALATITTTMIVLSATVVLGVSGLIFYQSKFKAFNEDVTSTYATVANKIQESLYVENAYYHNATQSMNVTLTNNGYIPVEITNASLMVGPLLESNNATVVSAGNGGVGGGGSCGSIAIDSIVSKAVPTSSSGTMQVQLSTSQSNEIIIVQESNTDPTNIKTSPLGISDSAGLTWKSIYSDDSIANGDTVELWYAVAASKLSSDTITVTLAKSTVTYPWVVIAYGISNANTASPFDGSYQISNSGTSGVTDRHVLLTTTNANDMIIGALVVDKDNPVSSPPGGTYSAMTLIANPNDGNGNHPGAADYQVVGSPGSYTVGFTFSSSPAGLIAQAINSATCSSGSQAGTDSYIPITLTNSQSSATPVPFQEEITFNPSLYTSAEKSDLGNIRFCADSACTQPLYSWLETCGSSACTNISTSATAWVRLTNAISANGGTQTIYMYFESLTTDFDTTNHYWGESYQAQGSSFTNDNIGNVMNTGLIEQMYYDGTECDSTNYQNSLYSASLGSGSTVAGCETFTSSNFFTTTGTGSSQSVNTLGSESYVITNYEYGYTNGIAWPNPPVANTADSWNVKAVGWTYVTSSATMDMYVDDGGAIGSSTTTGGFTSGGANWLGGTSNPNNIINEWRLQSGTQWTGNISTGDNRIEADYFEGPTDSILAMWSSASLNYYSFTYPPNGVMPTSSLGNAQSPTYKTFLLDNNCVILPGQSCTESFNYHCFSNPVSMTFTTSRGSTFQTQLAPVVPWYNNQWQYRKEITINSTQVTGTLTNFPVLVDITDQNLVSNAQASGNDILFTACDGKTLLKSEIENYTSSKGSLVAWVNVPALYNTPNDIIYMYYGNPNASVPPIAYVPVTLTNSQVQTSSTLTIDGSPVALQCNSSQTCTVTFSTSKSNDVIYVGVTDNKGNNDLTSFVDGSTPTLTWTKRQSLSTNSLDVYTYYAIATSPVSSGQITINTSNYDNIRIVVLAISGANTASPFDSNVGTAPTNTSTSNQATVNVPNSGTTASANEIIIGTAKSDYNTVSSGASGYTLTECCGSSAYMGLEYEIVSSTGQYTPYVNLSSSTDWGEIGDAIVAAPSSPVATPVPFQQKIIFNPSSYTGSEAPNLGNIRFCADPSCNTPLDAWLENYTGSATANTATSATVWVKLTSAIQGSGGAQTIYMTFKPTSINFDGVYWGEAPQLASTYGQYDNGANVFNQYGGGGSQGWNSFTTNLCGTGSWTSAATGPLQETDTNANDPVGGCAALIESTSYSVNGNYIIDSAFSYTTQNNARVGIVVDATPTSSPTDVYGYRFIGQQDSDGAGFLSFLNDAQHWVVNNVYQGNTGSAYTMSIADNAGVWNGTIYSGYGTVGTELTSMSAITYTTANKQSQTTGYVGVSATYHVPSSNTIDNPITVQWFRMRALPPNYVMPTVSFGIRVSLEPWDSNYVGVWHFKENPSGTAPQMKDSTLNGNSFTSSNMASTNQVPGKIDGSLNFESIDSQYLYNTSPTRMPANNAAQTESFWFQIPSSPSGMQCILSIQNAGSSSSIQIGFENSDIAVWYWGSSYFINDPTASTTGIWHYAVYEFDGTNNILYIDGVQVNKNQNSLQSGSPNAIYVGAYSGGQYYNGIIDEMRISTIARSAAWISTEYNNQAFPSTFYQIGLQQSYGDTRTGS